MPCCRALAVSETIIDRWWCRRECNPFWRLYCNLDPGASIRSSEGVHLHLEPHHCYLVPAWVVFKGRAEGSIRHRFIHFQVVGLPEAWLRRTAIRPCEIPGAAWPGGQVGSAAFAMAVQALLCRSVETALSGATEPQADDRTATVIAPALSLIDARLANPPSVKQLAAVCGVSSDHLARCFSSALGRTPMRYIREKRIALAAERLSDGRSSVTEVSAALGFANPFHFSRVFRSVTGVAPVRWRAGPGPKSTPSRPA